MTFSEFTTTILNKIEEKYKGKYHARLINLPKNNGGIEMCLNISKGSIEEGVLFKIESYYEHLEIDISIDGVINNICSVIEENEKSRDRIQEIEGNFKAAKDTIMYKLVNKKANNEWLKQVPHRDYFDMAIVYYILLNKKNEGQMSIDIENHHIEKWGVSENELYELAKENTPREYQYTVKSLREHMVEMMKLSEGNKNLHMEIEGCLKADKEFPLYELSQEKSLFGATAFIYPDVLKQLAEMMECDLIIIPASICEVLITPYKEGMDAANIKALLEHVNDNVLPFEEVLSNSVFRYSREADYMDYMWPDNPS